jgi:hypothetical protein
MIACLRMTEVSIETGQEHSNTGIQTDLEKVEAMDLEANSEETETTVEQQEIPNGKAAVDSMREWQKDTIACQERWRHAWNARSQPQWTWNPKWNMKRREMPR